MLHFLLLLEAIENVIKNKNMRSFAETQSSVISNITNLSCNAVIEAIINESFKNITVNSTVKPKALHKSGLEGSFHL